MVAVWPGLPYQYTLATEELSRGRSHPDEMANNDSQRASKLKMPVKIAVAV